MKNILDGHGRIPAVGTSAGVLAGAAFAAQRRWLLESEVRRATPVETDPLSEIPAEADVVVIGAGIAGISTALYLKQFGLRTVVSEKRFVGGEALSRNFGWVYTNALHHNKVPLAVLAKDIWMGFADRFGFDVGVRRNGNLQLIANEEHLAVQSAWQREATQRFPRDVDARILGRDEIEDLIPNAGRQFIGALHQPSDGSAEPTHAVPVISKGARAEGVKVFAPVAVRGIETAGGAIHSVVMELGEVRTKRVVEAASDWSRLFLGNLGVDLPQQGIASSLMRVKGGTAFRGAGIGGGAAWREQIDGSYAIGVTMHAVPVTLDSFRLLPHFLPALKLALGNRAERLLSVQVGSDLLASLRTKRMWRNDEVTEFERVRMLTARPMVKAGDRGLAAVQELLPALRDAAIVERWAGVVDATPDYTSVVSEVPAIPGLFVNTGHGAQGYSLGPGVGRLAAEIIAEKPTSIDADMFRFSRFSDGSPLRIREFI
ncbi:NAD(P)/FAD-dependent oxidoreductase [Modestobacter sp. VKM Ac-2978]|uniref:NAD(P)/FAD-dependent oxidoreductase n=1 Tax=Modestobacter sp. VKM Ac-2978 TaxID=3004132 RepID=UPI0022AB01D1|nr:FAD-binding oxidoreductase [Modestobacter sp. VKM Ac-2978]MCZ2849898.1 FAD-binding oxidoreductase [Modestobacter sp. VKM Ac-2978]